jgi:hypothetical protein
MSTVDIGSGVTSVLGCPKKLEVTLTGVASSVWATDAILKVSTTLKTDTDGYELSMLVTGGLHAADVAHSNYGGCIVTTGNYVCMNGDISAAYLQSVNFSWILKKDFVATAALVAGTTITLAKWQFVA